MTETEVHRKAMELTAAVLDSPDQVTELARIWTLVGELPQETQGEILASSFGYILRILADVRKQSLMGGIVIDQHRQQIVWTLTQLDVGGSR